MAKTWRNKSTTLELKGFDELIEKLQEAGKSIDVEGRKCFEGAAENLYDALYNKAQAAGLKEHLLEQIEEEFVETPTRWSYKVGWKKVKPKNPLPDFYKIVFYNYGTPGGDRVTKAGKNRGQEPAHPKGSHGFIKKAKTAAANKNRKLFKDYLNSVLGDL